MGNNQDEKLTENVHTVGGPYIGKDVKAGRDFVGRDVIITTNNTYKLESKKSGTKIWSISITLVFIFVVFIPVILIYADRDKFISEFTISNGPITIEQINVSRSRSHYKVEVTGYNPLREEVLVNKITIGMGHFGPLLCSSSLIRLQISDQIEVNAGSPEDFQGEYIEASEPDYTYPISGHFWSYCDDDGLNLELNTAFALPAKKYSRFDILIPESLQVLKEEIYSGLPLFGDESPNDEKIFAPGEYVESFSLRSYDGIRIEISLASEDEPIIATASIK